MHLSLLGGLQSFFFFLWGKIIIPMYRLWLNGLYGLYGPRCPLFSKRPINLISLSLSKAFNVFLHLLLTHLGHCFMLQYWKWIHVFVFDVSCPLWSCCKHFTTKVFTRVQEHFIKNGGSYLMSILISRYEQLKSRALAVTFSTKGSYFPLSLLSFLTE